MWRQFAGGWEPAQGCLAAADKSQAIPSLLGEAVGQALQTSGPCHPTPTCKGGGGGGGVTAGTAESHPETDICRAATGDPALGSAAGIQKEQDSALKILNH